MPSPVSQHNFSWGWGDAYLWNFPLCSLQLADACRLLHCLKLEDLLGDDGPCLVVSHRPREWLAAMEGASPDLRAVEYGGDGNDRRMVRHHGMSLVRRRGDDDEASEKIECSEGNPW